MKSHIHTVRTVQLQLQSVGSGPGNLFAAWTSVWLVVACWEFYSKHGRLSSQSSV